MIDVISSWHIPDLHIYREIDLGYRFVGVVRKIDILLEYHGNFLGIEAKFQRSGGSTYQKITYALEDAHKSPTPVILAFSSENGAIKEDMQAKMISSGIGLEIQTDEYTDENKVIKSRSEGLLKQRLGIELGFDWLHDFEDKRVE